MLYDKHWCTFCQGINPDWCRFNSNSAPPMTYTTNSTAPVPAAQPVMPEPDCWAVLTPNGSRLVSPDEAKGLVKAYPLYTAAAAAAFAEARCARMREAREDDLYWRLHSLSTALESSGRIDAHEHPDAYATILDAMGAMCALAADKERS